MTTPQRSIGSGFGPRSSTSDVLQRIDLGGRLAIVTGGYSGLGLEATRALAGAGARVVVAARRPRIAAEALDGVDGVEVDAVDLADLASVHAFAERFLATGRPIDILVNNAAVMACPETRVGPGWEAQLAINHLGHYALVNDLWPALAQGRAARVVAVASGINPSGSMRWDDLQFERGYDKWAAYGQSKEANALFAQHLDTLGRPAGVRAFSAAPGWILTPLQRHLARTEMVEAGWIDDDGNPDAAFKTPEQGAATPVWAATSPQLAGMGGVYCRDCDIADPADVLGLPVGSRSSITDADQAERLWTVSAELTGVDAFAGAT